MTYDQLTNHSDLLKMESSSGFHSGVRIDGFSPTFRLDLNEIGIFADFDHGAISFDTIDTCIGYIANGIGVILEVPFESDYPEETLFVECMSMGMGLSVLPPNAYKGDCDEVSLSDWDSYKKKLVRYTNIWLNHPMNDQQIYPVSGFFGYMVAEKFGYRPTVISDDPYVKSMFVDGIPLDVMDDIKVDIRSAFYDHFGGIDGFNKFADSLALAIGNKLSAK